MTELIELTEWTEWTEECAEADKKAFADCVDHTCPQKRPPTSFTPASAGLQCGACAALIQ